MLCNVDIVYACACVFIGTMYGVGENMLWFSLQLIHKQECSINASVYFICPPLPHYRKTSQVPAVGCLLTQLVYMTSTYSYFLHITYHTRTPMITYYGHACMWIFIDWPETQTHSTLRTRLTDALPTKPYAAGAVSWLGRILHVTQKEAEQLKLTDC